MGHDLEGDNTSPPGGNNDDAWNIRAHLHRELIRRQFAK